MPAFWRVLLRTSMWWLDRRAYCPSADLMGPMGKSGSEDLSHRIVPSPSKPLLTTQQQTLSYKILKAQKENTPFSGWGKVQGSAPTKGVKNIQCMLGMIMEFLFSLFSLRKLHCLLKWGFWPRWAQNYLSLTSWSHKQDSWGASKFHFSRICTETPAYLNS